MSKEKLLEFVEVVMVTYSKTYFSVVLFLMNDAIQLVAF
jgi:hypothetical protein